MSDVCNQYLVPCPFQYQLEIEKHHSMIIWKYDNHIIFDLNDAVSKLDAQYK